MRYLGFPALFLAVLAAACSPALGPTGSVPSGHYKGNGAFVSDIQFDVSSSGQISGFHGHVMMNCNATTLQPEYGVNPSFKVLTQTFVDPNSVSTTGAGTFKGEYDLPGSKGKLTYSGKLDGKGGASGFVSWIQAFCSTAQEGWHAALPGKAEPPIPVYKSQPSPAADACDPAPCGTSNDLDIYVSDLALNSSGLVTATVEVDNNRSGVFNLEGLDFSLQAGDAAAVLPVAADGCDFPLTTAEDTVKPGDSVTGTMCWGPPAASVHDDLKLTFQPLGNLVDPAVLDLGTV